MYTSVIDDLNDIYPGLNNLDNGGDGEGGQFLITMESGGDPHIKPLHGNIYTLPSHIRVVNLFCDEENGLTINSHVDFLHYRQFPRKIFSFNKFESRTSQNMKFLYSNTYYRWLYISFKEEEIMINMDSLRVLVSPKKILKNVMYTYVTPQTGINSLTHSLTYPLMKSTRELSITLGEYVLNIKSDIYTDERHYLSLKYISDTDSVVGKCTGALVSASTIKVLQKITEIPWKT
jgi:hypothetical protein